MTDKIKALAARIKEFLIKSHGMEIREVLLYGSCARATAGQDSDVDLLVVVADGLEPSKVRAELSGLLYDLFLETGELFSVMVIPETLFKTYNSPFLLNVREEGVRL